MLDAVVVGSGPNGLAAAITMARAGCSVFVIEGKDTIGGGTRTAELTLPGFLHDVCSAIHPLSLASPLMRSLPLADFGLQWIFSPAELAHPVGDGPAILVERSVKGTSHQFGPDSRAYQKIFDPFSTAWEKLIHDFLSPLRLPRYPLDMLRFGLSALRSASGFARGTFQERFAQACFAGYAAHSIQPLESSLTAGFGLMLGMLAHAVGWPLARGGSGQITDAMAAYLKSLGGEIQTGHMISSLTQLPPAKVTLFDVSPRAFLEIAGDLLPASYKKQLARYRYGPGVFKLDHALSGPIPWKDARVGQAATVHLGGTLEEIAAGERLVWRGEHPEQPFVLLAQTSLFDASRAPHGKHTAWAYCHVPNGSDLDMTSRIEAQIERFAPGFRDLVLARHTYTSQQMEAYNPNYVGGDINGGVQDLRQFFTRPVMSLVPYRTPLKGVYLCSSSTPPGGGVHGMCGYHAARLALHSI